MSAFRMNAKNVFLTYAQCGITKEAMQDYLVNLEGDRIAWMVIAREKHADGNPHLHVQIQYEEARNVRNPAHYDFEEYHPNVSATRNLKKVCVLIFYFLKWYDFLSSSLSFLSSSVALLSIYYRLRSMSLRMVTTCSTVWRT